MAGHLDVLMSMFPQKMFLDINDIAKLLNVSKGHIYNLSSAKKLPFKLYDDTDKIQVSIVEMARYLDSKLEQVEREPIKREDIQVVQKRGPGRPRGGSIRLTMAFQSQLSLAIIREEVHQAFGVLQEQVESLEFTDDQRPCATKLDEAKDSFSASALSARNYLNASLLQVQLGTKPEKKGGRFKP